AAAVAGPHRRRRGLRDAGCARPLPDISRTHRGGLRRPRRVRGRTHPDHGDRRGVAGTGTARKAALEAAKAETVPANLPCVAQAEISPHALALVVIGMP